MVTSKKINAISISKEEILLMADEMSKMLDSLELDESLENVLYIISEFNKKRDHYLTLYWVSYIGYLLDINDEKYKASEKVIGEVNSLIDNLRLRYYKIIIKSKYQKELRNKIGDRVFALAENESVLLNDSITDLTIKEKELYQSYMSLIVNTKFEFNGETINLSKLAIYNQSDDRDMRKKAFDKRFEILLSLEEEISKLFEEVISVRTKLANRLGFESYSQVGDIKMNRIGYNNDDLNIFKKQVKQYIVPLLGKLKEMQRKRLGLKELKYYDVSYLFADGNAKVIIELDDVINKTSKILNNVCNESGQLFDKMIKNGLINLDNNEGKSNGGITTFLPDYKVPMFIKKYLGIDNDIATIHHEFGHCQQLYYSRNLLYHENRWPTFDICEIHSTSMEFLMYPYLNEYFGTDDYKYKIKHLTDTLSTIVNVSAMDDFQHYIYDNPTIGNSKRNKKWLDILDEYYPNRDNDHIYLKKGINWQTDSNKFHNPFYGIDYAIASICALSFYEKVKKDEKQAWADFIELCKIGGAKSLVDLITASNLRNPFINGSIQSISSIIETDIISLNNI